MDESPLLEDSRLASQEIPRHLWNPKFNFLKIPLRTIADRCT
jgi:hypothetical protein